MNQTAVELLIASIAHNERTKWMVNDYEWKAILKQARLEEKDQLETYKYTEEDLRKAIKYGQNYRLMDEGKIPYISEEQFIQEL